MMPEPEDDTVHYCLPAYRAPMLAREWTCPECGVNWELENAGRESRWIPVVTVPECTCESMSGRFGAHRPECPWQVAFKVQGTREMAEAAVYDTLMDGRAKDDESAALFALARQIVHDLIESGIRLDRDG